MLQPGEMSPDERLREIAGILACGILRLRKAHETSATGQPKNLSDSDAERLEVSGETVLSVHNG